MKKKKVSELAVEYILTRNMKELSELSAEKIAEAVGVNTFYLSLAFMIDQRMGIPAFIMREKLHEAYFLIEKDKQKSIDQLSGELGFASVEDFDAEFEKYYAVTPERFKEIKNLDSR